MTLPAQGQLLLPLLAELERRGGKAKPADLYDSLADQLAVTPEDRAKTIRTQGSQTTPAFNHRVRWARQEAVLRGYIAGPTRNLWELTQGGRNALRNVRHGVIITLFETKFGFALWANAEDAVSVIERESIQLIYTSPPYPLTRPKAYQAGTNEHDWLDWMSRLADGWADLLTGDGSLMLNLGPVWTPGSPTLAPYTERLIVHMVDKLGWHLAQKLYWHNPAKLPAPAEWVTVRRVRLKPSIEEIIWFSKSPNPKADNRRIPVEYSPSMRQLIDRRGMSAQQRPSGHAFSTHAFDADNGGAIRPSLIVAANTASNDPYHRATRDLNLPAHPAISPELLPELAIQLATDKGDTCYDPFLGSGTTAAAAERLERHWIGSERSLAYLEGARARFAA